MRMGKSGKKTIGMTMAAIIVASVFAMVAPVSVADPPVPSGKVAIYYLVPDNSSVPDGYWHTTDVQLRVNTTGAIRGGKVSLEFNRTCGNITGITFNTAIWDDTVANKFTPLPDKTVITYGATSDQPSGDYLIGNLTIHCNSSCCASNLSFISETYISNSTGSYYMPADVSADNGTFICGKPLVINKTVKDPATGNWIDGPLTLGPNWLNKNITFKITVTAACENLSNVVVNDTMGPRLKYKNASINPDPTPTDHAVNWTIGSLTAGSSWTVTFNATIVEYGTDHNTAKTSGTVDKIGGVGVEAEDSVTIETKPPARIDVEKTVWSKPKGAPDYNSGTWVNAVQGAKIGEIYRFNCTIHNNGNFSLTDIRFWDILNCSLEYVDNATLVTPDGVKRNITLPTILHLHSAIYPLDKPDNWTSTWWHELYPNFSSEYHMKTWEDNNDGELSPSDQILLETIGVTPKVEHWYHVDDVTVTLELINNMTGEKIFVEFEGGYERMEDVMCQPVSTYWHEVYPNFSRIYHLERWDDTGEPYDKLSPSDKIVLQDEKTSQTAEYHVNNVTVDIIARQKDEVFKPKVLYNATGIDISNPVCTILHELSPIKCNTYHLKEWDDTNNNGNLDGGDQILLNTAGKCEWFHVEDVTAHNITVSREYRVDEWLQENLTLQPCQKIIVEYDAHVVNYGNDSNVQCVKGYSSEGNKWVSDCDNAWINTPKPDLIVSDVTINYDANKVKNNAIGPLPPNGTRTQCNNLSANRSELNGVPVKFAFNVTFEVNGVPLNCSPVHVPADTLSGGDNITVYCNCSFYPIAGVKYNISVTVDSDNEIIESDETNNTKWRNVTAKWLGLKGDGWQDGRNITKLQCHEQGTINITYSAGDSKYLSGGSNPDWTTYTVNWTASDLPIPPTDTCIKKARLYVYYTWDKTPGRNISDYFTMKFNGYEVQKDKVYTDAKEAGSSWNYGMVAYNVTDKFIATSNNTAVLTNSYPGGGNVSMEGMFLVVVYDNPNEPERIIMMNEGLDWIKADDAYGVSTEEATTYATFTCPAIPLDEIGRAKLITVTVDAGSYGTAKDPDWQALYFNGVLLGKGKEIWPVEYSIPTVNETDVTLLLNATNNTAAIQSYKPANETYGDSFEASLAFLVLEKVVKEIKVVPRLTIVQPQEQFEVEIVVDTNGHDLYGVSYELYYNNSVLIAETQVPGNLSDYGETSVVINNIDQASGKIEYGETMLGDSCADGTIVIARIQFTAIGAPDTMSDLDLRDVMFVDCDKNENKAFVVKDGRVWIYKNNPPVAIAKSKHRFNNAAKKYQCSAILCACESYDPDQIKDYNISYIRWAFGDGQYGTSEGIENCMKRHQYESWIWVGGPDGHYEPFVAMLTVTDDGEMSNSTTLNVIVYIAGDANGDGVVNIIDAAYVGKHWHERCNQTACECKCCDPCWDNPQADRADLNNDCYIDIMDLAIVGANWKHTAW